MADPDGDYARYESSFGQEGEETKGKTQVLNIDESSSEDSSSEGETGSDPGIETIQEEEEIDRNENVPSVLSVSPMEDVTSEEDSEYQRAVAASLAEERKRQEESSKKRKEPEPAAPKPTSKPAVGSAPPGTVAVETTRTEIGPDGRERTIKTISYRPAPAPAPAPVNKASSGAPPGTIPVETTRTEMGPDGKQRTIKTISYRPAPAPAPTRKIPVETTRTEVGPDGVQRTVKTITYRDAPQAATGATAAATTTVAAAPRPAPAPAPAAPAGAPAGMVPVETTRTEVGPDGVERTFKTISYRPASTGSVRSGAASATAPAAAGSLDPNVQTIHNAVNTGGRNYIVSVVRPSVYKIEDGDLCLNIWCGTFLQYFAYEIDLSKPGLVVISNLAPCGGGFGGVVGCIRVKDELKRLLQILSAAFPDRSVIESGSGPPPTQFAGATAPSEF